MSIVSFKVASSNPTKNNNFCNKLVSKETITVDTEFGKVEQERTQTYYLFTTQQNPKDMEAKLDLGLFDTVEKDYEIDVDGSKETIQLKYLYPKRQA